MVNIRTFKNCHSPTQAENILRGYDPKINIIRVDCLYYPYLRILYSLRLKGRLSVLDKEVNCIFDLLEGKPAVGKDVPEFVDIDVDETLIMEPILKGEALYKKGHDFVFKLFLNKSKILNTPTIAVEEEEPFYKKFYLVQCEDPEGTPYYVLVDSMDGSISILDAGVPEVAGELEGPEGQAMLTENEPQVTDENR